MSGEIRAGALVARPAVDDVPILNVRNLHVQATTRLGHVELVRGVELGVRSRELVGVVGESGSGKSTLCRAIARVLADGVSVRAGRVEVEGTDLLTLSSQEIRRLRRAGKGVAMVFQEPLGALNPVMRIGEQVAEAVAAHGALNDEEAREQATAILERMGIPRRRLRDYPHQFSGGQRQRVVLAIALSCKPRLLVADEPTSALDVSTQAQILSLIRSLAADEGIGVLIVTHDLRVVTAMCDTVAVMYGGQVVEIGTSALIRRAPRHPYTAALLAAMPSLAHPRQRLEAISGVPPHPSQLRGGCPFTARCKYAAPQCENAPMILEAVGDGHRTACLRFREIWPDTTQ